MYRDGPQAPGGSGMERRAGEPGLSEGGRSESFWTTGSDPAGIASNGVLRVTPLPGDLSALVRARVQAIVTRHGLSALIGRRPETAAILPACDEQAFAALAAHATAGDTAGLRAMLAVYVAAGWSPTVLLVDLLTPTIRLIGRYWEEDRCDFATTTLACALLQSTIHEMTAAQRRPVPPKARAVLLAVAPGDDHVLGTLVVAELLQAAGWPVETRLASSAEALAADVRGGDYVAIGFSLARTSRLDGLRATIRHLRTYCTHMPPIIVGGRVFAAGEAQACDVGADVVAIDGPELIGIIDELATIVAAV